MAQHESKPGSPGQRLVYQPPAVVRIGDLEKGIGEETVYLQDPVLRVNAGMEEVRVRSASSEILLQVVQDRATCQ